MLKRIAKRILILLLFFSLTLISNCSEESKQQGKLTTSEVNKLSREITVSVEGKVPASGVIISHNQGKYYILTSEESSREQKELKIFTKDGKNHTTSDIVRLSDSHLTMASFYSNENYLIGELEDSKNLKKEDTIFVTGFNSKGSAISERRHQFSPGKISKRNISTGNGYKGFLYENRTLNGMGGGPILDSEGGIVGIHNEEGYGIPIKYFLEDKKMLSSNIKIHKKSKQDTLHLKSRKLRRDRDWDRKFKKLSGFGNVKIDNDGFIYALGNSLDGTSKGLNLVKFDSSGNLIWDKQVSIKSLSVILFLDQASLIYMVGPISYTEKDPSGVNKVVKQTSWLAKFSDDGSLIWEQEIESFGNEDLFGSFLIDLAPEESDDIYILETFHTQISDDGTNRSSTVVVKLNANGQVVWSKQIEIPSGAAQAAGIEVLDTNSIFVAANSSRSSDSENDSPSAWLLKLDGNGSVLWSREFDTPGLDQISGIRVNENKNLYVWGETSDSLMKFNPNVHSVEDEESWNFTNVWLASYSEAGTFRWKEQIEEVLLTGSSATLEFDNSNNVYIFFASLNDNPITLNDPYPKKSIYRLHKYDDLGNLDWFSTVDPPDYTSI